MKNIVTLKWGNRYGPEYVNRLYRAVQEHLTRPWRFICFTDNADNIIDGVDCFPLPALDGPERLKATTWRKLALFRGDLPIEGLALFLDLDLIVTGNLDVFFEYEDHDSIPIIHNWIESHKTWFRKRPEIGNSSVFRFPAGQCVELYQQYLDEMSWAIEQFHPPQTYLTHVIRPRMQYWPDEWVISFKRHLHRPFPLNWGWPAASPPAEARIVVFHGRPDPPQAAKGYRGKKPHHRVRPTPWVEEYWEQ